MKAKKKIFHYNYILLLLTLLVVLLSTAVISVSKFVLEEEDELRGKYTHFYLSHNGEGLASVLEETTENGAAYKGFFSVAVSNTAEGKISERKIRYYFRMPTAAEIAAGKIVDAWGNENDISAEAEACRYYTLSVTNAKTTIDDQGTASTADDVLGFELAGGSLQTENASLKLLRSAQSEDNVMDGKAETIVIVLETTNPYSDRQVFRINVAHSLIAANALESQHLGFSQITLNVKTASAYEVPATSEYAAFTSTMPAIATFTWSEGLLFDEQRFVLETGMQKWNEAISFGGVSAGKKGYYYDEAGRTLKVYLPAGSNLNVYFYLDGGLTDGNITFSDVSFYNEGNGVGYSYASVAGRDASNRVWLRATN